MWFSDKYIPVISCRVATIFHSPPVGPRLGRLVGIPDLLSPNDVLDIEGGVVVHNPLRYESSVGTIQL